MCNLLITSEDIKEAEHAILPEGCTFNAEQVQYIKCLDSIDLDACPGSGKSTALVAKLFILAKHKVWEKGEAICVISHTNVAIDEIKEKVAKYFPQILEYPNFIGTFQTFIDKYLALPYYRTLGLANQAVVDDDQFIYQWNKAFQINRNENYYVKAKFYDKPGIFNQDRYLEFVSCLNYRPSNNNWEMDLNSIKLPTGSKSPTYTKLHEVKKEIFDKGFLKYGDTLYLAALFLQKYPHVSSVISARFNYIFLDEAQDCTEHQLNILDTLFNKPYHIYQRLGDPRQAIYETESDTACAWDLRINSFLYKFTGSNRFGNDIAEVVSLLGHSVQTSSPNIQGLKKQKYQNCLLLPFEEGEELAVIERFSNKLKAVAGKDAYSMNIYAVGAVGKKNEAGKLSIASFCPSYEKATKKTSNYFHNNAKYFSTIDKVALKTEGTKLVYDRIINCLYNHLRNNTELATSKNDLEIILEAHGIGQTTIEITKLIVSHEPTFLNKIEKELGKLLTQAYPNALPVTFRRLTNNEASPTTAVGINAKSDLPITYTTIHSVKGQTHDATLLLTTQHGTLNAGKVGEMGGTDIDYLLKSGKLINRRKLTYVAASRPRYFFAWAIPKSKLPLLSKELLETFEIC